MSHQRYELLLQRSCRPGFIPVNWIAAASKLYSHSMAFLGREWGWKKRLEKSSPWECRREAVRSYMWLLVPLGWGSLRKEGFPSADLMVGLVLSLPAAAENRHPHAPEPPGNDLSSSPLGKRCMRETLSSLMLEEPHAICLGPAALAVAGTPCEKLWWERVGRHCLHRVRCHQNQREMETPQFAAE